MVKAYKKAVICMCILSAGLFAACTRQKNGEEPGIPSGTEAGSGNSENAGNEVGSEVENESESTKEESAVWQEGSVEDLNRDILAACTDKTIVRTMESADGKQVTIDAEVIVDGVSRVSCYRYVPQPVTEDFRKALLADMFPAEAWDVNTAAAYDAEADIWQFVTPRGEHWIFKVRNAEDFGGQIFDLERMDIDMDYTEATEVLPILISEVEDMRLMEVTGCVQNEIEQIGIGIIGAVTETDTYSCSYIHICEKEGAHPYAKAVYRQIIDGMPVTVRYNFSTATSEYSRFPVKVWGALFTAEETGLEKPILSPEEAADALQEQIGSVLAGNEISVTRISPEYLAVISPDGEAEIVPVWRFFIGADERERIEMSESILAVHAVSGELIWERRSVFTE